MSIPQCPFSSLTEAVAIVSDNPVMSNPESKWYNRDLYDHDVYPQYASGPGYFLGRSVMDFILDGATRSVTSSPKLIKFNWTMFTDNC